VKIDIIDIFDNATPCNAVSGGHFTSSSAFNAAGLGITITDGTTSTTIATSTNSFVGFRLNFVVNVYNGATIIASRNYFTKIPSATLIVGDTHITTVDGVKYDFQAVGEFVALRADGGDNLEIQTRQTAVATSGPGTDQYDGLSTCVSVNTAVAARVGKSRVTYEPRIDGVPDSTGMELRVDGKLTELGDKGIDLGSGGRIMKSPAGGGAILIDFPDGASLAVTPGYWTPYKQWYLNISINNTTARMGISGAIASNNDTASEISRRSKSWLPALPDGSSVGFMPQDLHQRFITLYQQFANAWRVTDATSLFDYAPGKSTATYTNKNWPAEHPEGCSVEGQNPKAPIDHATAEQLANGIVDPILKANAIYDVMITGEATFAQTYLRTQQIQTNTTAISVYSSKDTTKKGEAVTFTANVVRKFSTSKEPLTGSVEFTVDGKDLGQVNLDASGNATLTTTSLETGQHQIAAKFTPASGSTAFASSSLDVTHIVIGGTGGGSILHQWWFWLVIVIIVLLIIWFVSRKKNP
jgi:hypothetical protein